MRQSLRIRDGRAEDADCLAVLAVHVWLHTYATDGIDDLAARYVLSELTPEKYARSLSEPATHFFVAENDQSLLGFAVVEFSAPCPAEANSSAELRTLYVQEHHVGQGVGKALLQAAEAKARRAFGASALWLKDQCKRTPEPSPSMRARAIRRSAAAYFVLGEGRHENHVLLGSDA